MTSIERHSSVTEELYQDRLSKGWPEDLASTSPDDSYYVELAKLNKERAKKQKEEKRLFKEALLLAESNGIKQGTFRYRVSMGATLNEAATIPVKANPEYAKYSALARANGISNKTFRSRVFMRKWSLVDSATTPTDKSPKLSKWSTLTDAQVKELEAFIASKPSFVSIKVKIL